MLIIGNLKVYAFKDLAGEAVPKEKSYVIVQCGCLWALHRLYQGRCRLFHSEESGYMRLHHSGSTRKSRISLDQQGREGVPENGNSCTKAQRSRTP